jgi:hypothetical protein
MIKILKEIQSDLNFAKIDAMDESDFIENQFDANVEQINGIIDSLTENCQDRPKTDHALSKEIYNWLIASKITPRMESDRRFWQSLSLFVFRDYIAWRWASPLADYENFTPSQKRRFLGSGKIGGYSHNTISRLYFPAKILLKESDGEKLLESFWDNQQKEQSFMQNETAMIDKVVIALTKTTKGAKQDDIVRRAKKITAMKNSRAFSYLSEKQLIEILTF